MDNKDLINSCYEDLNNLYNVFGSIVGRLEIKSVQRKEAEKLRSQINNLITNKGKTYIELVKYIEFFRSSRSNF